MNANNSDLRGAAIAGKDAVSKTEQSYNSDSFHKDSHNSDSYNGVSHHSSDAALRVVSEVVRALRSDEANIEDAALRHEVQSLADKLEAESTQSDPDYDRIDGGIHRAERYVARAGSLMAATASAIGNWIKVRDSF